MSNQGLIRLLPHSKERGVYICWQGGWGGAGGYTTSHAPTIIPLGGSREKRTQYSGSVKGSPRVVHTGIPVVTWSCASGLYGQMTPWFYGSMSCDPMSRGSMVLWFCVPWFQVSWSMTWGSHQEFSPRLGSGNIRTSALRTFTLASELRAMVQSRGRRLMTETSP